MRKQNERVRLNCCCPETAGCAVGQWSNGRGLPQLLGNKGSDEEGWERLLRIEQSTPPRTGMDPRSVGSNQKCGVAEIGGAGKGNNAVGRGKVRGVAIEKNGKTGKKIMDRCGREMQPRCRLRQLHFRKCRIHLVGGDGLVGAAGDRAE